MNVNRKTYNGIKSDIAMLRQENNRLNEKFIFQIKNISLINLLIIKYFKKS